MGVGYPLQNRVTPYGDLVATPARGLFLGNRGILHNDEQQIVTPFRLRAWIICRLEFKGRQRTVMTPGTYTELFFLDEATALAAGHRPCFECRRPQAVAYREAWLAGNPDRLPPGNVKIGEIDRVLESERLSPARYKKDRRKLTYQAQLASCPAGTFVEWEGRPCLYWATALHPWSADGYAEPLTISDATVVTVLTPRSTVHALAHGYDPVLHHSLKR